jgi:hypothetical protein
MVVSVWGVMMITGPVEPVRHTRRSSVHQDGAAFVDGESRIAGEAGT